MVLSFEKALQGSQIAKRKKYVSGRRLTFCVQFLPLFLRRKRKRKLSKRRCLPGRLDDAVRYVSQDFYIDLPGFITSGKRADAR